MHYKTTYKDALGNPVTELIKGSYEMALKHCQMMTRDNPNKGFLVEEVKLRLL